jgi:hypothetical protein
MSFIAKAVKKVFRKVKKFVKRAWDNKWVRTALLVGATVFTAGLAAGGWAFQTGTGITGFFSSVGKTFAAGWNSITTGVKSFFGQGAGSAGSTIGQTSAEAVGDKAFGTLIDGAKGAAEGVFGETIRGAAAQEALSGTLVQQGKDGFLKKTMGWLFGDTKGAAFARSASSPGIRGYWQREDVEWERNRRDQRTIAGGRAFGDQSAAYRQPLQFTRGEANSAAARASQPMAFNQAAQQAPQEFAAQQQGVQPQQATGLAAAAPQFNAQQATQIIPQPGFAMPNQQPEQGMA